MIFVKALRSPSDKCEMSAVISVGAKRRILAPTEEPGGVFVSLVGSVMFELHPVKVIRTISTNEQIRSLFFIRLVSHSSCPWGIPVRRMSQADRWIVWLFSQRVHRCPKFRTECLPWLF